MKKKVLIFMCSFATLSTCSPVYAGAVTGI
nr:MAG TPA: hypothetical protein [Caudoviricetes sp.]